MNLLHAIGTSVPLVALIGIAILDTRALAAAPAVSSDSHALQSALAPGALIRVTVSKLEADQVVGTYRSLERDSLLVQLSESGPPSRSWSVALVDLDQVERCTKRKSAVVPGLVLGGLAGGAFLLSLMNGDSEGGSRGVVLLVPLGAIMGALVGSGIHSYDWAVVWENHRARPK